MKFLVEIELIDDSNPTATELKEYIEDALSCYSARHRELKKEGL